jgi:hypothetical protein
MKFLSIILLFIITMSPTAKQAFSDICGMKIISGTIDIQDNQSIINAIGINKDGIGWEITCWWKNGLPQFIVYENPKKINAWL